MAVALHPFLRLRIHHPHTKLPTVSVMLSIAPADDHDLADTCVHSVCGVACTWRRASSRASRILSARKLYSSSGILAMWMLATKSAPSTGDHLHLGKSRAPAYPL